ncbi:diguanylate cyclase (GGDEF)-like protein/PAS domain S-box-containing protein [Desulfohalotomaculum tongense]|uniref:bifunctional diguanylate cyclase/phosphodiesterase n=1 Tax=Desulforadius tongensis TaxID=1216062 RepID=UPI00195AD4FB|nr:bifunctional diguanylate cyclase/phosphodiesterase [Desulforadius tongensis]MBM7854663.1 diguanylate cyclase (GGDEF)-like protein/PAS domain S-box-containing protein [Desulforadius tongensis]
MKDTGKTQEQIISQLYNTLMSVREGLIYFDTKMKVLWANRAAGESIGLTPEQLVGHHCYRLWQKQVNPCPNCSTFKALKTGQPQTGEIITPDGRAWFTRSYPVKDSKGSVRGIFKITMEITQHKKIEEALKKAKEELEIKAAERTAELKKANRKLLLELEERKRTEEELRAAQRQLLDIIEFLPDATFVVDSSRKIIAWNRAIEELTGVHKNEIIGKTDYSQALPFYNPPGPTLIDLIFSNDKEVELKYDYVTKKGNTLFAETYLPLPEKKEVFLWVAASPLLDSSGKLVGAIETMRDITERKKIENQLQHLAMYDFLTDIPNRYSLEKHLKRAVAKAKRGEKSALLFIDLDNFKLVNDALGHAAGDRVLITLTNLLKKSLRKKDLFFRFGGDEFVVLLENTSAEEAKIVAEKLRRVLDDGQLCLSIYRTSFNLTISIGIVMIDGNFDPQKILSLADNALYSAKEEGRNKIIFMQPGKFIGAKQCTANKLIDLIKKALHENRFTLFFQPVVKIDSGKIIHHEVLLRLPGDDGKLIAPGRFIPAAERSGLITEIDRWVIKRSIKMFRQNKNLNLFINLSGTSIGDDSLLEFIKNNICSSGIDPSRVGFEITETAAVKNLSLTERWIQKIKDLGCNFALDDFGKGFSSFSYLRLLPVDYLKLDGSFVRNIDKDLTHRALVQAMNAIAQTLDKKTIAEFVETEDILKILLEMGIDYGQGYYLGRPVPHPTHLP